MSLTGDPWRPSAGRDHILCGAFKKRPLGGTGHIRVLAHFPKGQKIIRCTEPNSTNPIHNYTHKSNKLCHITGKLNYYIETFNNFKKKKKKLEGASGLKCFLQGQERVSQIPVPVLAVGPPVRLKGWSQCQHGFFIQGWICAPAFLHMTQASAMTLSDITVSFLKTHLNLTFLRLFCFQTQNSIKNNHCWWHQEPELRAWRGRQQQPPG